MVDTFLAGNPGGCHAMEGVQCDRPTCAVHCRLSNASGNDDGFVLAFWHQPRDRLQVGAALHGRAIGWIEGSVAGRPHTSDCDAGGYRADERVVSPGT